MTDHPSSKAHWTRRKALAGGGALLLGLTPAAPAIARVRPAGVRRLAFYNLHTHEKIDVEYFADGALHLRRRAGP